MHRRTAPSPLVLLALSACAGLLPGCRGDREEEPPRQFFPDLDDQLKWKPQTKSEFFSDGRTMRQPVAGTVPFARVAFAGDTLTRHPAWAARPLGERDDFLKGDDTFVTAQAFKDGKPLLDKDNNPIYVERIPFAVDRGLVELGQEKFSIYCSVCHGYAGDGQGMVGKQWAVAVANFHDPKYKQPDPKDAAGQLWKDGYLFHTARVGLWNPNGTQRMPGYAHALSERETWGVVAYIRALQASRDGTLTDLPEAMRQDVERGAGRPAGGTK